MDWSGLFQTLTKLAPLPLFVVAASSAVCLFAGDSSLRRLGLLDFRNAQRAWIGVAFLVSAFYLLGHGIAFVYRAGGKRRSESQKRKELMERLGRLTAEEKERVKVFILGQSRCCPFMGDDTVMNSLEAAGIVYKPSQVLWFSPYEDGSLPRTSVKYTIVDWAWVAIVERPELVFSEAEIASYFGPATSPTLP